MDAIGWMPCARPARARRWHPAWRARLTSTARASSPSSARRFGENLRRTVERFPDRDALVVRVAAGYRATYTRALGRDDRRGRARAPGARGRAGRPRGHLVAQPVRVGASRSTRRARIGAILVNINPAYKTAELEYALRQSGASVLLLARRFRQSDYVAMLAEVRDRCPDARAPRSCSTTTGARSSTRRRGRHAGRRSSARERGAPVRRPDQHPVHVGHDRLPQGSARSRTTTSSTTASSSARRCGSREADRVCIPVPFYHCFGMVLGNLACTTHGAAMVIPGEAYEPRARARGGRGREVHRALRRADDVHRRARAARLRRVRSLDAAHRHHGRLALPGRGDEERHLADAHARGDDLLRHDRDVAGLDPDAPSTIRSRSASAPSGACTRTSR